ncbi:hypothetical protein [Sphingomonas panaciterrae]|uniref:hypothetical protein n=1 Tax=Sphingomonas panaciterrae TaxID=1462999 RepID=UPI002FEFA239
MIRAFAKSVLAGALVGAAPYLLFSTFFALLGLTRVERATDVPASLLLAIAPLLVAAPIVAGGALLIGLPFTAWLARHDRESAVAYIAGGLVAGAAFAALLVFVIDVRDGYWLAGLGAASGGVTGWTWWASARRPDAR